MLLQPGLGVTRSTPYLLPNSALHPLLLPPRLCLLPGHQASVALTDHHVGAAHHLCSSLLHVLPIFLSQIHSRACIGAGGGAMNA
jgi:hypothetical protein